MANIPMPLRDANGMQLPAQYDAAGKPYYLLDNGAKQYLSPGQARSYSVSDPTLASNPDVQRLASDTTQAGGEGFGGSTEWDPTTGTWKHHTNWLLDATTLGAGGVIAAPFIAGALGAGGAGAAAGTPTVSGATGSTLASTFTPGLSTLPSVGASGLATSAAGAAGGSTLDKILKTAVAAGGPVAAHALAGALSGGGGGSPSGDQATTNAQLAQLLQLMVNRAQSTVPVHDAAMRLAMSLAPSGTPNPRMTQAIAAAQTPRPGPTLDPAVQQAIQSLMAGKG